MTTDTSTGEIVGQDVTQRTAVAALKTYADARSQKSDNTGIMDATSKLLKDWLEKNDGELWDGENRLRGVLKPKGAPAWADFESMGENEADLLLDAAKRGLLKLDGGAWKALKKTPSKFVERFGGYVNQGEGNPSLQVTKEE